MDQEKPLVSIVMNCYNCESFLKTAIDSVYSQTYENWEIIFWDNCSEDSSAVVAKSYDSKLKYFKEKRNLPLGEARNKALKKANGDYIAFLDCDDIFLPDKLTKQVATMQTGNYGMCYGSAFHINKDGKIINKRKISTRKGNLFSNLLRNYDINMQTVMINSSIYREFGINFDTELQFSPDYDLFMEIAVVSDVVTLSDYLSMYRVHASSLTHHSQSLVCEEGLYTLNRLILKYDKLSNLYTREFKVAISTFNVQDAILSLKNNDVNKAKNILYDYWHINPKAFVLLMLILFQIPAYYILKIIGRG